MEETFIAIKPEGVQRELCGEVFKSFESKGYKLIACIIRVAPRSLLEEHYTEHKSRSFFQGLVTHMSSVPVMAMIFQGKNVNHSPVLRSVESKPGTIRGDFVLDTGKKIVHGSDGPESAEREFDLWFKPDEKATWGSWHQS